MFSNLKKVWRSESPQRLVEALTAIDDIQTMKNFLRDVLTEKEIIEISSRLEAADMLKKGFKYNAIIAQTKLSSRTVARISEWLQNGCNGYEIALEILNDRHNIHTSPARAV